MPKLNQILAIEKETKTSAFRDLTEAHHSLMRQAQLTGIARSYRPKNEEDETLPAEATKVQVKATEVIAQVRASLTKLFDVTATKEWANTSAKASIELDGAVFLADVPVTYLLFLEKQLTDLHTFVKKLPELDAAETWAHDPAQDCWATEPIQTHRTKKIPRNHVKAEATDKHPAQVETYYEDVTVGYWQTVKYSGALPKEEINTILGRLEKLQAAVKFAREEANTLKADEQKVGDKIFSYLFG